MATVILEPLVDTLSKELPAVLLGCLCKSQMPLSADLEPNVVFPRLIREGFLLLGPAVLGSRMSEPGAGC